MNALMYLLQVNLYLLLFYSLYFVLLRNETFFKMNRFYLVGSALLSLAIPLVKLQWVKELFLGEQVFQVTQKISNVISYEDVISERNGNMLTVGTHSPSLSNLEILAIIYGFITLLFLFNFLRKLYQLKKALQSDNRSQAFSFFNKIVVDDSLEGKDTIIDHEMVHVRQWHSLDVIFLEIFTAFNWFNPIAFLYKKAIKDIHEFIADDTAASKLEDKSAYTLLLVSNVFGAKPQQLTNSFFNQSLLKRRIIMLHKTKSRQVAILKYGLSVPLFVSMVILSSATATAEKLTKAIESSPIIGVLSNSELSPIEEIKSPDLNRKVDTKKKAMPTSEHSQKVKNQTNTLKLRDGVNPLQNIMDYVGNFKSETSDYGPKEGVSYFSFDVNESKEASNFKVIKSANVEFEKELLAHLTSFKDTVSLKKGTYNFYRGMNYGYPGDDHTKILDKAIPSIFGTLNTTISIFLDNDETKSEAGRIVNYVKVPYFTNPIILVDGKVATYKVTDKGFRLDETLYPKQHKTKVLRGDDAVAAHNETARNGLIVITTE
jgi:hypothetical protein